MIRGKEFNGERLKSARLYRNKTIEQLSKETKIFIDSITEFEEMKAVPSPENILSLSNKLNFPKDYFFEKDSFDLLVEGSVFNVHSSNYRKEEKSYIEKILITHKIFAFIERYITFPKMNVINLSADEIDIDDIANKLRAHYKLSNDPVINMVNLLERNGFIISTINSSKNSVGPFLQKHSLYNNTRYFMALGNDKKSVPKRNYDLGVLLGHVVLHDPLMNIEISKEKFKSIKEEAKSFSRAFLLPKEEFLSDLAYPAELDYYVALKRKYIVPIDVMILRAYEVGAISYRKYDYLLKEMAKKGWDKKEPLEEIKGANPSLSKQALDIMEENNIIKNVKLVEALSKEGLSLYYEDVEELLGLKKGKLKPKAIKNEKIDNLKVVDFRR